MPELNLEKVVELTRRFYAEAEHMGDVASEYSREEVIAFLRSNVAGLRREVEGMSQKQLAYRAPGVPDGPDESGDEEHFDTSQIMTHMATGTAFHWWNMTRAMRHERPPMPRPPEGTTTTGKKKSGLGAGGWKGLQADELCKLLEETVDGFITYVKQLPEDTGDARSSFGLFRDMTPHDWLFAVAAHTGAHLLQIREMKSMPDFPQA
ncbi:MAG: DinB family protein [Chloroflexota bacterium]